MGFFASLGIWNWFILGALLLIAEALVPGTFMLWLGLAALAVGALAVAGATGRLRRPVHRLAAGLAQVPPVQR
jgi:membrane-bound ClpP family serine protease